MRALLLAGARRGLAATFIRLIPRQEVSPVTLGVAAVLLTVPFWMSFAGLLSESRVNCTTYEVDITSGRFRETGFNRVLELWQEGQRPEAANRYLEALWVVAVRKDREQRTTEVADLPSL